jgi:hypothetical protein
MGKTGEGFGGGWGLDGMDGGSVIDPHKTLKFFLLNCYEVPCQVVPNTLPSTEIFE